MGNIKKSSLKLLIVVSIIGSMFSTEVICSSNNSAKRKTGNTTELSLFYLFDLDRFKLPFNNSGVIADVVDPVNGSGGKYDNIMVLFSAGFFVSGYTDINNDSTLQESELWANGVLTASRLEDYSPGPVGSNPSDPKNLIYVVKESDEDFGLSWQNWSYAVSIGADYYDGNQDGNYNPVDLNGNGMWDSDEDKPDLLGSITAWCVYNDGVPQSLRRYTVEPQGIEIKQTMFVFEDYGSELTDVIFLRYNIENKGTIADVLESVYFAAGVDPDLGEFMDDLVGCDTLGNTAFVYNPGPDALYGNDPPAFFIKQLQGPPVFIPSVTFLDNNNDGQYTTGVDTPLDSAIIHRGKDLGINYIEGASNLNPTAVTQYMQSHPSHGDPNTHFEARNYLLGGIDKNGIPIDPCTWAFGNGATLQNCSELNPKFMYSGDPVAGEGWLNITPIDQRLIISNGPFKLETDKPIEIIYAYIIERGADNLSSISKARETSQAVQRFYESNFVAFPTGLNDTENFVIEDYKLYQNYPNPFNPSTSIKFSLSSSGYSTLKIYNSLGEQVAVLLDKEFATGTYEIEWNASGLPSGVYFYQINTEDFVETKKMILLK